MVESLEPETSNIGYLDPLGKKGAAAFENITLRLKIGHKILGARVCGLRPQPQGRAAATTVHQLVPCLEITGVVVNNTI